ncbi:MAG: QueT transporter family protein [Firmicutes bacterium]|nr:QueT transporter family protein [Bacillota bacterium]
MSLIFYLKNAMIASIYVVLLYVFQFLSFELVQFRIAELLLVLVLFNAKSFYGITIGTFVGNMLFSPYGFVDAVVGTIATIITLVLMIILKRQLLLAFLMPGIVNGIIIGLMLVYFSDITTLAAFIITFSWIFLGQTVVLFVFGYPFYKLLKEKPSFQELIQF